MNDDYRYPVWIQEELSDLQELIRENETLKSKYPDKFSLNFMSQRLKEREKHLLLELENSFSRLQMDTIYLAFDGDVVDNYRVSLSFFGNIMSTLQEIISSIAQSTIAYPTMKGSIPKEILTASKLDLVATATGSFKVVLSSHEPQIIPSVAKTSFQHLHGLIGCQDNKERLKEASEQLGPRVLVKYQDLMEIIYKNKANVKMFDKINNGDFNSEISNDLAKKIYDVIIEVQNIPEEVVQYEGILKGISLVRNNFEFLVKDSEELIIGKFEDNLIDEVKNHLDTPTIATFNLTTTLSDLTEDEKKKDWNLVSFDD